MYMFDVIVIGGGPGGYVAAIKLAQLGFKVACVEGRKALGGTCLNVGCIPSKTLLEFSEKYYSTKNLIAKELFEGEINPNFHALMQKKESIVASLTNGIAGLFKKNKVERIEGFAKFKSATTIIVEEREYYAKNFIIATGSCVTQLPGVVIDEEKIVSSTGALSLKKIPEKMLVIGAGVIGLEMGSIYSRLGSKVEVIEYLPIITPSVDAELAQSFKKILESQGITFRMKTKVISVSVKEDGLPKMVVENTETAEQVSLSADIVLVAIGRKPFIEGLELQNLGVRQNEKGFIIVDNQFRTAISNIYAIGDVIPGPMLAHKAEEEGIAVAEILAGKAGHVNYNVIPSVIYTHPEVASVGKTEGELKAEGIEYNVGKFPFMANSRAKAVDDTDGFVKILAEKNTDKILGVHIIGKNAGDLIHEAVVAMEFYASSEDIARSCHAHPTLNEAIKEACLAAFSKPIHI